MATVGNKAIVAIEWEKTQKSADGYQYAHFCFWIKGERIGDFEDVVILSTTVKYLEMFLKHYDRRTIGGLCARSKEDIFNYIHESVMFTVSPHEKLHESLDSAKDELFNEYSDSSLLRERFHLDDVGGAAFMDKYNIILFNDTSMQSQRLIWRNLCDMKIHEFSLTENHFDQVAIQFLAASKYTS